MTQTPPPAPNPAERVASETAASSTQNATSPPPGQPSISRYRALVYAAILVVLAFVIPEAILRAINYPPPVKEYNTRPDIFWGLEANLVESPFLHKELGVTFNVSTNSQSMRYAEVPLGAQPRTLRLLALGDSTTFGWGVEQDMSYPAQLERNLQETHPEIKIEVLNGGVPGYTSFQGLHHYKKNGAAYEPDLVLFGYIVQDARRTRITDKQQAIEARSAEFLRDYPLYRINLFRALSAQYGVLRSYLTEQSNREAAEDPEATTRVPIEDYRENILTFKKLVQDRNSGLFLFGFPLEVVGYTRMHRDLLAELARSEGLPHYDPSSEVSQEARKRTLYFPQDKGHPNADGCTVIASLLADHLERSGLITALIEKHR